MKAALLSLVVLLPFLFACDTPDVNNRGAYKFLPGSTGIDTAVYPLSTLLIVEQDAAAERTLFYLFEGELGKADLGIADLRRVATGFGLADIRFDFPLSYYGFGAGGGSAGAGGEGGSAGGASAGGEPVRTLTVDGESVDLFAVTDQVAFELGVTRYLSAIESTDYHVSVYWGRLQSSNRVRAIRWSARGQRFEQRAELRPIEVDIDQNADRELVVKHDELRGADYKVVDLFQRIVRSQDSAPIEALVRTSFGVDTEYDASSNLLSSVGRSLCWSRERPLVARVEQVARSYHVGHDGGDFAVIQKRRDEVRVPAAAWQGSAPRDLLPSYCDNYE